MTTSATESRSSVVLQLLASGIFTRGPVLPPPKNSEPLFSVCPAFASFGERQASGKSARSPVVEHQILSAICAQQILMLRLTASGAADVIDVTFRKRYR